MRKASFYIEHFISATNNTDCNSDKLPRNCIFPPKAHIRFVREIIKGRFYRYVETDPDYQFEQWGRKPDQGDYAYMTELSVNAIKNAQAAARKNLRESGQQQPFHESRNDHNEEGGLLRP